MSTVFASRPIPSFVVGALFLAACAVGPDFTKPEAPVVSSYDVRATPETTADGAQKLESGKDIPSQWWTLFHSPDLNQLIGQAIQDNPDLASANAALRVAEDNLAAGQAELLPVLSGGLSSERQKTASAANGGLFPGFTYSLYNASVGVSYGLDVFGGTRRAIESLEAEADMVKFQKEAAYLALTSNVVTTAIEEASLREQIEATRAIIEDQEHTLKILKARFEAGAVPKSAVLEQQAVVSAARTNLPPLDHQLVVTRHALSALIGQLPANEPQAQFKLADLTLPPQIPLSLPSALVEQRPDIKAAEENLHAASAEIGIAVAARLPQITLSADIGSMANVFTKLLSAGTGFWGYGADVSETLFDAGALADKEQAARDAFDGANAQYRKTVLAAFQNVADTLHALQSDAESLNEKMVAAQTATDSVVLEKAQFESGAVTIAELLNSEQLELQAQSALAQARAQRYADTAALFAALGGGWWNRDTAAKSDTNESNSPPAETPQDSTTTDQTPEGI